MNIVKIKQTISLIFAIGFVLFLIFYGFNEKYYNDCEVDLSLNKASQMLNGNKMALNILEKNCLWLLRAETEDFDGDGKEELAMIGGGAGCGSCNINWLYILKDSNIIFEKKTDDVDIWTTASSDGFMLKYPIRKEDEALCCPSEGIVEIYKVSRTNNSLSSFYKISEYIEQY